MHEAIKTNLLNIHDEKRDIVGYIETVSHKGKVLVTEYSLESSQDIKTEVLIYEIFGDDVEILPGANVWTQ